MGLQRIQMKAGYEDIPAQNVKFLVELMEESYAISQQKLQGRRLWGWTCGGQRTFSSSHKLQLGFWRGDWKEPLSSCLHVSLVDWILGVVRVRNGDWLEEENIMNGSGIGMEGKIRTFLCNICWFCGAADHLRALWALKYEGCTESDRAVNPVRASNGVLLQKLQVNPGRKEKAVLGQLWLCMWLMAYVPFYWEQVTISRTGWSLGPCCVLEQGSRTSVT